MEILFKIHIIACASKACSIDTGLYDYVYIMKQNTLPLASQDLVGVNIIIIGRGSFSRHYYRHEPWAYIRPRMKAYFGFSASGLDSLLTSG